MDYGKLLQEFITDDKFVVAAILIALDLVLGTAASFRLGTFRVSYLADFARNDILFKLVPWFTLFAAAEVAGSRDIVIPGLDVGALATAMFALVVAAWVGSIYSSLGDLGINLPGTTTPEKAPLAGPLNGEVAGPPHG